MRFLAVGAHPDDIEFHCGGTLLRCKQNGHHVTMAVATNGDKGHFTIPSEELAQIRKRESEAAAQVLGAEHIWMGFADGTLVADLEHRLAFIEMVRLARPDVVLAHDPEDYHPDHRVSYHLVRDAVFLATVPHVVTASPATTKVPALFRMETSRPGFLPTDFVDISAVFEEKLKALRCHACQFDWIQEHDGVDMSEPVRVTNRFRGQSCGVEFAEAFHHEGNTTIRLLP